MKLILDPLQRMQIRMTLYGLMLGACSGLLLMLTANFPMFGFLQDMIFGTLWGLVFGGIAGCMSGFLMVCITSFLFFDKPGRRQVYLPTMAIITFSGTVFILAPLIFVGGIGIMSIFGNANVLAGILMSIVIAIYVSQIVARKYLRESDPRKLKEGMAV